MIVVAILGNAFHAKYASLYEVTNRLFNPMINAGAIAFADLAGGKDYPQRVTRTIDMFSRHCGRTVYVGNSVFTSERMTGQGGVGTFSLKLDVKGNSMRGIKVFEELAQRYGLHVFEADDKKQSLLSQFAPPK